MSTPTIIAKQEGSRTLAPVSPIRPRRSAPPSFEELARVIGDHADVAALVLRAANCVLNAPQTPIDDVHQAVVRLGVERVRRIVRSARRA